MDTMDSECQGQKSNSREPVRSSMVVMTGKLLGVTESIAAMNVRIAAGVVLCIILLIATFVVNVIAFDYAKDQESKDNMMVDKSSGEVMDYHTRTIGYDPELDLFDLMKMKHVAAAIPGDENAKGVYWVGSIEQLPCPKGDDELADHYCQDGELFLITATSGHKLVAKRPELTTFFALVTEDDLPFVNGATTPQSRKLLKHTLYAQIMCENAGAMCGC